MVTWYSLIFISVGMHTLLVAISCYNSQSNLAYNETLTAWTQAIDTLTDESILEWENESLHTVALAVDGLSPLIKSTSN